jgi:alpha-tubulin suppressor-like RCC1 family protein
MKQIFILMIILFVSISVKSQCYSDISTKGFHNLAIRNDGSIWSWGNNDYSQIGNNTTIDQPSPIQITQSSEFVTISVGTYNSTAIKDDGSLWYWGRNFYGTTGTPDTPIPEEITEFENCVSVATGLNNTAVIKSDRTLWVWGWNEYGTNGDGTYISSSTPNQVGSDTNWSSVSIGSQHISAIKTDGSLWAWGRNNNYAIGNNVFGEQTTPLRIGNANDWNKTYSGYSANLAIKNDGSLWAWGWNSYGQLGDGTTTNRLSPVQIGNDYDWVDISITTHSLAIKSDGTLWAWGYNNYGKLGLESAFTQILIPTQVGTDNNWIKAIAGFEHTIALKDDETLWAWGHNNYGQLGDGTTIDISTPTQIGLTCLVLDVDDLEIETPIIYPNPIEDFLNLKIDNSLQIDKVILVDLNGNNILEVNDRKSSIDISSLSSGFYICRIYSKENVFNLKIIKN